MNERMLNLLAGVGFSRLESKVYASLLREPDATGYRIARIIGKPVPNTYKALDSLRVKGAVLLDETSGSRTYTALPIGEYLDGLKRGLETKKQEIEDELTGLAVSRVESGTYRLTSIEQVYARARSMLQNAGKTALLDIFPACLEELKNDIRRAARRGVHVFIKAYEPTDIPGCDVVAPESKPAPDLKIWNGDWLNLVTDCREYLLSFLKLKGSGVHEAVWSRNAYLSLLTHNGVAHELVATRMIQLIAADKSKKEIAAELRRLSKPYFGEAMWQDAVPEAWKKPWPDDKGQAQPESRPGRGETRNAKPRDRAEKGRKR